MRPDKFRLKTRQISSGVTCGGHLAHQATASDPQGRLTLGHPWSGRAFDAILVERMQVNTVERSGVQHAELFIAYRLSEPGEAAALIFPRTHRMDNRYRPPEELNSLGDHLLRRRLTLKLLQRQVAQQLGVDKTSICNWEIGRTKPGLKYMPAIIQFLGYNPLPPSNGWADRLVLCRLAMGLSQKESARRIGVDQSTLSVWERGEREPNGALATRALRFVTAAESAWLPVAALTA